MKTIETQFKRIESKYLVSKDKLDYLMHDLKTFLVEDDYPTSTITNVYFDTDDFQIIQDSIAKKHLREKNTYEDLSFSNLPDISCFFRN